MLAPAIRQYLDEHFQQHLENLCQLLAIPSISSVLDDKDNSCNRAADWLVQYIQKLGLSTKCIPSGNGPYSRPAVIAHLHVDDRLPTLLMYAHYDVQPADPLEQWISPPFTPTIRNGRLYARGATDDKGQLMAQLMAIEAYLKTAGRPPVNLKLFYEGQEEIGSPDIRLFMQNNVGLLKADAVVITDTGWIDANTPSITSGLRGLVGFEVTFTGPRCDLHSGLQGGVVRNPINALAALIASFHDEHGRVDINGFYNDVLPLTPDQRQQWKKLPCDDDTPKATGSDCLSGGEEGFSPIERRWGRPTLDCNGIFGGHTGSGSKTIIPSAASVKFTCRLVANQTPQRIVELVQAHVARYCPPGIKASITIMSANPPFIANTDSPAIRSASAALAEVTNRDVAFIRSGGSIAAAEQFQSVLGLKPVMMGFDLPGCNMHSPNESWPLEQLKIASLAIASFMDNLAGSLPKQATTY